MSHLIGKEIKGEFSILQVIASITITMDPTIQHWFIMCFQFPRISQGSVMSLTQHRQRQQARSGSRRGSCRARRSTLPSPPSSPRQPNAIFAEETFEFSQVRKYSATSLCAVTDAATNAKGEKRVSREVGQGRRGLITYVEDADSEELDALAMGRVVLERPLRVPPVAGLEGDPWRAAVNVEHLDGEPAREGGEEGGHAGLERLLVRVVDAVLRRQRRPQERVVAADGRHLLPAQRLHPCHTTFDYNNMISV
jgi:hypothetical protein